MELKQLTAKIVMQNIKEIYSLAPNYKGYYVLLKKYKEIAKQDITSNNLVLHQEYNRLITVFIVGRFILTLLTGFFLILFQNYIYTTVITPDPTLRSILLLFYIVFLFVGIYCFACSLIHAIRIIDFLVTDIKINSATRYYKRKRIFINNLLKTI